MGELRYSFVPTSISPPHIEFSDGRKQPFQRAAPFLIQDNIRSVIKQQSMVIANAHDNLDATCSMKAAQSVIKQVVSLPPHSDSADEAAVITETGMVKNEDYIEIKQGKIN